MAEVSARLVRVLTGRPIGASGDTLAPPAQVDNTIAPSSQIQGNNTPQYTVSTGLAATNAKGSTTAFTANTGLARARLSVTTASSRVNQNGIANWAYRWGTWAGYNGQYFGNDCTDFVSRALHYGGGLSEVTPSRISLWANHDNNRRLWYDLGIVNKTRIVRGHYYSNTWSVSDWSYAYQISRGGKPVSRSGVRPGDIAYANFKGGSASGIDHAAIVTQVHGSNIYVAQQSSPRQNESIYKAGGGINWQSANPKMTIYFLDTSGER